MMSLVLLGSIVFLFSLTFRGFCGFSCVTHEENALTVVCFFTSLNLGLMFNCATASNIFWLRLNGLAFSNTYRKKSKLSLFFHASGKYS